MKVYEFTVPELEYFRTYCMDSVGRLMVEVFDMLQAMILDADFRDERQAIMQQIRKLADS